MNKLTGIKGFGEGDPKADRHIHAVGLGHGKVKGPQNMERNPVLSAKSKALGKKTGMYTSPTGSKHRMGSRKHQYWAGIIKRGEDNAQAGVPND